jgi:hypothetical protein
VSKQKNVSGVPTKPTGVVFVVNAGGRTESVLPDHPAALIANGDRRQPAEWGNFRLATDQEIEVYRRQHDPSHPAFKGRR